MVISSSIVRGEFVAELPPGCDREVTPVFILSTCRRGQSCSAYSTGQPEIVRHATFGFRAALRRRRDQRQALTRALCGLAFENATDPYRIRQCKGMPSPARRPSQASFKARVVFTARAWRGRCLLTSSVAIHQDDLWRLLRAR